jgi:thioredoxin-like negative regulator of GroEL
MDSSKMSNIATLRDEAHLTLLCQQQTSFIVLVYSNTCKPCQKLKPHLFDKTKTHNVEVFTFHVDKKNHASLMTKLEVEKVPHVACFQNGLYKGSIQNSDITVTWPFVEQCIDTFDLDSDF